MKFAIYSNAQNIHLDFEDGPTKLGFVIFAAVSRAETIKTGSPWKEVIKRM